MSKFEDICFKVIVYTLNTATVFVVAMGGLLVGTIIYGTLATIFNW